MASDEQSMAIAAAPEPFVAMASDEQSIPLEELPQSHGAQAEHDHTDYFALPTLPTRTLTFEYDDDDEDDIYRGEPPQPPSPPRSPRPDSVSSSSSSTSSSSSSSSVFGGRLGAISGIVERAISHWARAWNSSSSLSDTSSTTSSTSITLPPVRLVCDWVLILSLGAKGIGRLFVSLDRIEPWVLCMAQIIHYITAELHIIMRQPGLCMAMLWCDAISKEWCAMCVWVMF